MQWVGQHEQGAETICCTHTSDQSTDGLSAMQNGQGAFVLLCFIFFLNFVSDNLALTVFLLLAQTSNVNCLAALAGLCHICWPGACHCIGSDHSDFMASEQFAWIGLTVVFAWTVKTSGLTVAHAEAFPILVPQTAVMSESCTLLTDKLCCSAVAVQHAMQNMLIFFCLQLMHVWSSTPFASAVLGPMKNTLHREKMLSVQLEWQNYFTGCIVPHYKSIQGFQAKHLS